MSQLSPSLTRPRRQQAIAVILSAAALALCLGFALRHSSHRGSDTSGHVLSKSFLSGLGHCSGGHNEVQNVTLPEAGTR